MLPRRAFPIASIRVTETRRHADFDLFHLAVKGNSTANSKTSAGKSGGNKGSWTVFKRFSQFQALYESIVDEPLCLRTFPSAHMFNFGKC